MSDLYYEREDQLEDTPKQALANYKAQANGLANVVPEVATALEQSGQALGELYNQAQTAGNVGAMALISATWERNQMMANAAVQIDTVKQSAEAVIATFQDTLSDLEAALASGDDSHPMLREFAADIRQDEANMQQEYAEESALEYAFEVTYDTLLENLQLLTGLGWRPINRFVEVLQGDYPISDLQAAELKAFIEGLEMERDGAE